MVMGKKIHLVVEYHEFLSEEHLTEILQHALGFEISQAANCAAIIINKGSYTVKTFPLVDTERAKAIEDLLHEQDVPAKLFLR
jgi:hypothetical protein